MYDTRLGRWWTGDPIDHPWQNPYNSMSNNPITNIDPDGRADIYYKGKWIGTDGINDNLIAIVRSDKIRKQIMKNTRKGLYHNTGGLVNGVSDNNFKVLDRTILKESLCVLQSASNTINTSVEHSTVLKQNSDGGYDAIFSNSPPANERIASDGAIRTGMAIPTNGDVSIHSHPMGIVIAGEKYLFSRADVPTPTDPKSGKGDASAFKHFDLNIIVGDIGNPQKESAESKSFKVRKSGVIVYDSDTKEIMRFGASTTLSIVEDRDNSNKKAKEKFEAKRNK